MVVVVLVVHAISILERSAPSNLHSLNLFQFTGVTIKVEKKTFFIFPFFFKSSEMLLLELESFEFCRALTVLDKSLCCILEHFAN